MMGDATELQAWHFLFPGGLLRYGSAAPVDGEWLEYAGPLVMCESGLHASIRLSDAVRYSPGGSLCRVTVAGPRLHDRDILVAARRRIDYRLSDQETCRVIVEWGGRCVAHALLCERRSGREPDPRSWAAVAVAIRAGHQAVEESTAWRAVWSAVWSAARSVADSDAQSANWSAVWGAERDWQEELIVRMAEKRRKQ